MICNSLQKHVVSYLIGLNFLKRVLQIALANWQNIAKSNLSVFKILLATRTFALR